MICYIYINIDYIHTYIPHPYHIPFFFIRARCLASLGVCLTSVGGTSPLKLKCVISIHPHVIFI